MKTFFTLICLLVAFKGTCQSNRNINCDFCVDGLRAAAFNSFSLKSESEFKAILSMYFSMTDEQRKSLLESNNTSIGIKAIIKAIPVEFTGQNASQSDKDEYKRLEQIFKENQEIFSSDMVKVYSKIVDQGAVKAYESCVTQCIQKSGGESALGYSIEGDVNDEFVLVINWRPTTAMTTSKVASFEFPGLMLKNGATIFNGANFQAFTALTQSFKRVDKTKTAAITVSFVGLGQPIQITLDAEDRLSTSLPIGTVITSALNYEEFTGQTFDERKSIWAPADGRSVANSKYGKFNSNVPDLRGQFVRGLNQFHSPGQPTSIVNGPAMENDRRIVNTYSYQTFAIQNHQHEIEDPGHDHAVTGLGAEGEQGGNGGGARQCCHVGPAITLNANTKVTGIKIKSSGGIAETRPSNIALYYFIKIN